MALAFDALVSHPTGGTGNLTWNHVPVGTPRYVRVAVTGLSGSATPVTGVTYGGVAMTEITTVVKAGGENGGLSTWELGAGIPTGTQSVVVTVGNADFKLASAMTLTGAADVERIDFETWSSNSLANPSATLTLTGRTCFCYIDWFSGHDAITSVTPLSGWTDRAEGDTGAEVVGSYTYDTVGSTDVTTGVTQTADDFVGISVAVSEIVSSFDPATNPSWAQQSPVRVLRWGRMRPSGTTGVQKAAA